MRASEYEWETAPGLASEFEDEFEGELEGEYEEFFRQFWDRARQIGTQTMRRLGPRLQQIISAPPRTGDGEGEYEDSVNPQRRVYPDALMEHLGHSAAEAESESEAEAFIGALVPMAARAVPNAAPALLRTSPYLIRGMAGVSRALRSSPTTAPLVRTLPTVAQRTANDLAQQAARGQTITPGTAVQTLARQTARVLGDPRQAARAVQHSVGADERYHRLSRPRDCGCR